MFNLKNTNGNYETVAVSGGFIEVRPDKISILAPSAEVAYNRSMLLVRKQQKLVPKNVFNNKKDEIDFKRAELALKRAINRIKVHEGNV